jgi:hypothetical protein
MGPSALSRVISGKRSLDLSELAAVADYFSISTEELILEDEQVFAFRADAADGEMGRAVAQCFTIIDNYLLLEAASK